MDSIELLEIARALDWKVEELFAAAAGQPADATASGVELVALRSETEAAASALSWIGEFVVALRRLEQLEAGDA